MDSFSDYLQEASDTAVKSATDTILKQRVAEASRAINACIRAGGKILIAGNGGSAADAQHFAAEITGRFRRERPGLPAIALTTDSSALTAIANDYGYGRVFSRQVEALGKSGDVLILISTSGNSENLIHAAAEAKKNNLHTIALIGKGGGMLREFVHIPVIVPSDVTSHIQEVHLMIYHYWCDLLEQGVVQSETTLHSLQRFQDMRVGVIGDVMLDVYVNGTVDRISPEAPVPIIHITSEDHVLGGAANVARNIVALGGKATLVGVVGSDGNGTILRKKVSELGIADLIVTDNGRATTEKRRVMSEAHQILRVDVECKEYISTAVEEKIIRSLEKLVTDCDVICVADYGKGVLTPTIIEALTRLARAHTKKVIVDAKPRSLLAYHDVDLLTPNRAEVMQATGKSTWHEGLLTLATKTNSPVLMTCGADGMELTIDGSITHIDTYAEKVVDVSGAGDTVTATTALLRALDVNYLEAAKIASLAAAVAVAKLRTSPVFIDELEQKLTTFRHLGITFMD
jgi:phosphoheptose isomerase